MTAIYAASVILVLVAAVSLAVGLFSSDGTQAIIIAAVSSAGAQLLLVLGVNRTARLRSSER